MFLVVVVVIVVVVAHRHMQPNISGVLFTLNVLQNIPVRKRKRKKKKNNAL